MKAKELEAIQPNNGNGDSGEPDQKRRRGEIGVSHKTHNFFYNRN